MAYGFFCPAFGAEYPSQVQEILEQAPISWQDFLEMGIPDMISFLWNQVKHQISAPFQALGAAAGYLLLASMTQLLVTSGSLKEVLRVVAALGFVQLCCDHLVRVLDAIQQTGLEWHSYLCGFIPVFSGVMSLGGQTASGMVYSGLFLGLSSLLAQGIALVLIPGVKLYLALAVAAQLWENQGLLDAAQMGYSAVNWVLKSICALAAGILGLQGLLSGNADQLLAKGGKAVVKLFLPVVGDVALEAAAGMLASIRLLKGALAFGAVATIFVGFLPILSECMVSVGFFWLLGICGKSCGMKSCGSLAQHCALGIRLCLSAMMLYFLLVMAATLLMATVGGGKFG